MNKNIIFAVSAVIAVIGVGAIIKMSNTSDLSPKTETPGGYCDVVNQNGLDLEEDNEAAEIGEGEIKLTCENFEEEIINAQGIALVDMYSPTCSFCQKLGPVVSEIAKENVDKFKVGKLNVMVYVSLGNKYNIESVPALIFFKDGQEVERLLGLQTKEKIITTLEEIKKR